MMSVPQAFEQNAILLRLPPQERELLLPFCEVVDLPFGEVITAADEVIRHLHFPIDAAISLADLTPERQTVEVTVTGKEGCSGSSIVQGSDASACLALVQIGGSAVRVATSAVKANLMNLTVLKTALDHYNSLMMRHAVMSVGCSQYHTVEQRVARWLLAHWHRTGLDTFPFTTQFLAAQVGVEDKKVGAVLAEFQHHDLVESGYRTIRIKDPARLTAHSCQCFLLAKASTEQYVENLNRLVSAT
jgi:hypothetical protein